MILADCPVQEPEETDGSLSGQVVPDRSGKVKQVETAFDFLLQKETKGFPCLSLL